MKKIITNPLYIRCKKVVESCKTKAQIEMATNYIRLSHKKILKNIPISGRWDALFYFDQLEKELKEII